MMKTRTKAVLAIWTAVQTAFVVWLITVMGEREYLELLLPLIFAPLLGMLCMAAFLLLSIRKHKDGSAAESLRIMLGIFAAFAAIPTVYELLFWVLILLDI